MKKKICLTGLALVMALSLASCDESAKVEYTDAEGSKVVTEIKPTSDKEEVVKAVNALSMASKDEQEVNSVSANAKIHANVVAESSYVKLNALLDASLYAQAGLTGDENKTGLAYVNGTVTGEVSYATSSALGDAINGALGGLIGSNPNLNTEANGKVKVDEKLEAFYNTTEPKIYLSLNDSKGFLNVPESSDIPGDIEISTDGSINGEEVGELISQAIEDSNVDVAITNTTKDTVEFTFNVNPSAQTESAAADARVVLKLTVNTKNFLPVSLSCDLGAQASYALKEANMNVSKAELLLSLDFKYNESVKEVKSKDDYSRDLTLELKNKADLILGYIEGLLPEQK